MQTTKLFFALLLLALNLSCVENKVSERNKSELLGATESDTLRFTSGIRAIFQDSKGNFWFGSLKEGVAVYDGRSFQYFSMNEGLEDNQIHSIQEDKQGLIWFDTQTGISSFDGVKITSYKKSEKENAQFSFSTKNTKTQLNDWRKSENELWFEAGNESAVYRYDGQYLHYLELPPQKDLNPSDNLFAVTAISIDKNNSIWFATYAGVFGYNGIDFTIINDESLRYDRTFEKLHIRSVLADSKGRIWIGNNGIGVLLKEGESVINFSQKQHLIHANSKRNGDKSPQGTLEHVFTISEDKNGNIWFGDRDAGIWMFDGEKMTNYILKDGLSNQFATAIFEDKNGELWFGMEDGSVYIFNGKEFEKRF